MVRFEMIVVVAMAMFFFAVTTTTRADADLVTEEQSARNLRVGTVDEAEQERRNLGPTTMTFNYGWGYTTQMCPVSYYDTLVYSDGSCHLLNSEGLPMKYPSNYGLVKSYKGDCGVSGKVIFYTDIGCTQVLTQQSDACVDDTFEAIRFCCGTNCLNGGINLK